MQVEYEKKINYLNSIKQLKTIYQSISENDKNKISIMLPTSKDSSIIIAEIESIIIKNSAILNSIKVETQATGARSNYRAQTSEDKISLAGIFSNPPQEIGIIKIEIKLSSVDYQILKNIIKTFENNLRLFDISKVSFNVGKSEAVLNIYTYYLQQQFMLF